MRLETIARILAMRDEIAHDALLQGTADWIGASHVSGPKTHKIGLDINPSADIRMRLNWAKKKTGAHTSRRRASPQCGAPASLA
jgi:hypothetical protein